MIRGTLLLTFLLMSISVYCQSGYPKKILLDKDTVIAITPAQLKTINIEHINYMECSELLMVKNAVVDSMTKIMTLQDFVTSNLQQQISIKDNYISDKNTVIQALYSGTTERDKMIKKVIRQNTYYKIGIGISLFIVVISIII